MKKITPISIWDNGTVQEATVLNTYAVNVELNNSATFWWGLYSTVDGQLKNTLSQGNLTMSGEAYAEWQEDSYAWDWVAGQLNLTIIGDYVPPVVEPIEEVVVEPTETETEPEAEPNEPDSETDTETQPND
jgi:hypothetical protein